MGGRSSICPRIRESQSLSGALSQRCRSVAVGNRHASLMGDIRISGLRVSCSGTPVVLLGMRWAGRVSHLSAGQLVLPQAHHRAPDSAFLDVSLAAPWVSGVAEFVAVRVRTGWSGSHERSRISDRIIAIKSLASSDANFGASSAAVGWATC